MRHGGRAAGRRVAGGWAGLDGRLGWVGGMTAGLAGGWLAAGAGGWGWRLGLAAGGWMAAWLAAGRNR